MMQTDDATVWDISGVKSKSDAKRQVAAEGQGVGRQEFLTQKSALISGPKLTGLR